MQTASRQITPTVVGESVFMGLPFFGGGDSLSSAKAGFKTGLIIHSCKFKYKQLRLVVTQKHSVDCFS